METFQHIPHPVEAWGEEVHQNIPVKQIHVVGGGTIEPVRNHLALTAPAFGATARRIAELSARYMPDMNVNLHLTRLGGGSKELQSSDDLRMLAARLIGDLSTKVVFWSPAVTDFIGKVGDIEGSHHAERLNSAHPPIIDLTTNEKILPMFRKDMLDGHSPRTDIFAVGFKTTTGASTDAQFEAGLKSLKHNNLSLVLANDVVSRRNMIIAPDETICRDTTNREVALQGLVEVTALRLQMIESLY